MRFGEAAQCGVGPAAWNHQFSTFVAGRTEANASWTRMRRISLTFADPLWANGAQNTARILAKLGVKSNENAMIAWRQGSGRLPQCCSLSLPPLFFPPLPSLSGRGSACPLSSRAPLAPPSRPIPFLHDIICTSVVPTGCWWHRQATKLVELSLFLSQSFLLAPCSSGLPFYSPPFIHVSSLVTFSVFNPLSLSFLSSLCTLRAASFPVPAMAASQRFLHCGTYIWAGRKQPLH